MHDKNGNTVEDWARWHEDRSGHAATARDRLIIMRLIEAGYALATSGPDDS